MFVSGASKNIRHFAPERVVIRNGRQLSAFVIKSEFE
jgi:hypothetical protein